MAKKKPAASPAAPPAPTKKAAKKAAPKAPTAKPAVAKEKPAVAKAPALSSFSTEAIGEAAGYVWGALAEKGPMTVAALKQACPVSGDLVLAAIGWLAREDKLEFETSGRTLKVGVR